MHTYEKKQFCSVWTEYFLGEKISYQHLCEVNGVGDHTTPLSKEDNAWDSGHGNLKQLPPLAYVGRD
jgi:hypothetical protein